MESMVLELGLALGLTAGAAWLASRFRFSPVPLLILAGLAVGPHVPPLGPLDLRFLDSNPTLGFLGQMGVLFLLLHLGLEFSVGRLVRAGRSILWPERPTWPLTCPWGSCWDGCWAGPCRKPWWLPASSPSRPAPSSPSSWWI